MRTTTSNEQADRANPLLSFELINPSDPFTFKASTLEIAALAVVLLGDGQYGGTSLDTPAGTDVPIFLFGGRDEWFSKQFGRPAQECLDAADPIALAECMESFTLGRAERSSMNDIGGRAAAWAKAFRNEATSGAAA